MTTKKQIAAAKRTLKQIVKDLRKNSKATRAFIEKQNEHNQIGIRYRNDLRCVVGTLIESHSALLREYMWSLDLTHAVANGRYLSTVMLSAKVKQKPHDPLLKYIQELEGAPETLPYDSLAAYPRDIPLGPNVNLTQHDNGVWSIQFNLDPKNQHQSVAGFVQKHRLKTQLSQGLNAERKHCELFLRDLSELDALRKGKKK